MWYNDGMYNHAPKGSIRLAQPLPVGFILVAIKKNEQEKAIFGIVNFFRFEIWKPNYPRGVIFSLQNFFCVEKAESFLGPCLKFYWFSISSFDSLAFFASLIAFSVVFSMMPR